MKCRFAVVVYRDYDDEPLRFQVCDFTTAEGIENFLSTVVADGGGNYTVAVCCFAFRFLGDD